MKRLALVAAVLFVAACAPKDETATDTAAAAVPATPAPTMSDTMMKMDSTHMDSMMKADAAKADSAKKP